MLRSLLLPILLLAAVNGGAQWLNYQVPGTPRTPDGKVDLTAPAPRTAAGKTDLSGVWMHETTSLTEMKRLFGPRVESALAVDVPGMEFGTQHKYGLNLLVDFKPDEVALTPRGQAIMRERAAQGDPSNVCSSAGGFPVAGLLSEPIRIVQATQMTVVLYEAGYLHRQIYTDGRVLPKGFDLPAYLGHSAGHWEGDTLVVETGGFNDKTVLDAAGHPHGEALHVTERFRRRDFGHLDVEMTFGDPEMYTKPFTVRVPHDLLPDSDIFEMFCNENEKDRTHLRKN
jgi:hypothetical protein